MKRGEVIRIAADCLAVAGEFWECGVHRGKMSIRLRDLLAGQRRTLRLFDTFAGRPAKGPEDTGTSQTTFDDTSLTFVQARLTDVFVSWHVGLIPATFARLTNAVIAFAYVDLDLYASTRDALAFIRPRLAAGGAIVVDDYAHPTWPGVTRAVDDLARVSERYGHLAVIR